MSPKLRNGLLIGGAAAIVIVCLCGVIFLAIGAWGANDPTYPANLSLTQTAEALAGPTASPDTTPTLPAGAVLLVDETFDSNTLGLNLYEDASIQTSLQGGVYQAHFGRAGIEITPMGKTLTNFIAELDCKPFGEKSFCGVAFGLQPEQENFVFPGFQISIGGGNYGFDVIPPTGGGSRFSNFSFALNGGDWNHVRVEVMNGVANLYVNNQFVDDFALSEPSLVLGDVALIVGLHSDAQNGDSADLTVDNFKVWELP
jgi:hypothetical protein